MTRSPKNPDRAALDRRTVLKQLGLGTVGSAAVVGTGGTATADEGSTHNHDPIGPEGFGDVTALQAPDGTYYVYGTGMPMARSQDMVNWTPMGEVLTEDQVDWRTDPEAGLWAPDINYYDDQYYLYYSYSTRGSQNNPGIGLATAPAPDGPFTDQDPSSALKTSA